MSGRRFPITQVVWATGALSSLLFYGARALPLPQRTPIGTEQRLFGGTDYQLLRHPVSGRWLVSAAKKVDPSAPAATPPQPSLWGALSIAFNHFEWPEGGGTARALAPFRHEGTWELSPFGLRRVWRLSATNSGEKSKHPLLWITDPPAVLDLKTRRTYRGDAAQQRLPGTGEYEDDWGLWLEARDRDLEVGQYTHQEQREVAGRSVYLLWNDPPGPGSGLYAASDHEAPRLLRLAKDATFNELSPDGRTLFFHRGGALWRLDLRRPLQDLLDEAVPPPLPDPVLPAE